jgi:hypothetical protein
MQSWTDTLRWRNVLEVALVALLACVVAWTRASALAAGAWAWAPAFHQVRETPSTATRELLVRWLERDKVGNTFSCSSQRVRLSIEFSIEKRTAPNLKGGTESQGL